MRRDRFEQMKACLHFTDNQRPKGDLNYDLFQIRPIFEYIRRSGRGLSQEEYQVIGEQIVLARTFISLKQ